jgi:ferrochelatase
MTTASAASVSAALSGERKFAVLLLAHGTPDTVDDIPEYLKNVVSGRALPQHVVEEIQSRHAQIGKSPLTEWTLKQAELLQQKTGLPVYVGMRNWRPYIGDTVRQMRGDGVTEAVVICLAPQNSRTSVGLYRRAVYAEAGNAFRFHFVDAWADHPRLADAFADRLRPIWKEACGSVGEKVPVLFTAHSVPCGTIQVASASAQPSHSLSEMAAKRGENSPVEKSTGPVRPTVEKRSYALPHGAFSGPDPYAVETKLTATLVAERLLPDGLTSRDWYFAFQSQGMSGGPWIVPTVEETLECLHREGHRGVVLQPIGFLCDHVEILYDIDIAFQATARRLGMHLFRPESLNDSPLLIAALADLASQGLLHLGAAQFENSSVVAPSHQR